MDNSNGRWRFIAFQHQHLPQTCTHMLPLPVVSCCSKLVPAHLTDPIPYNIFIHLPTPRPLSVPLPTCSPSTTLMRGLMMESLAMGSYILASQDARSFAPMSILSGIWVNGWMTDRGGRIFLPRYASYNYYMVTPRLLENSTWG